MDQYQATIEAAAAAAASQVARWARRSMRRGWRTQRKPLTRQKVTRLKHSPRASAAPAGVKSPVQARVAIIQVA